MDTNIIASHKAKDPARRRSVIPEPDVAVLLGLWAKENPMVIEARMFNEALRQHLSYLRLKRTARKEVAA